MTAKSHWIEASRAEPCPICSSDGWCSRLADGRIIDCKRQEGAGHYRTTTTDGVTHHLHRGDGQTAPARPAPRFRSDEVRPAAAELRDRVYRRLLGTLGLSRAHHGDLIRRGLLAATIDDRHFASLAGDRQAVAARVRDRLGLNDAEMITVPGFFMNDQRMLSIAGLSGLLVPTHYEAGLVAGIQIRSDGVAAPRYTWLSGRKKGGAPAQPAAHCPPSEGLRATARLTEGMIKAELAQAGDGVWTISVPGVASWPLAIPALKRANIHVVRLAFDADWATNTTVRRAMVGAADGLKAAGFVVQFETWSIEKGKGIDDLITAGHVPNVLDGAEAARFLEDARSRHAPSAASGVDRILRSYQFVEADGQKPRKLGLRLPEIARELSDITGGWPKRIGSQLFVPSAAIEPIFLESATQLISWIGSLCPVDWAWKCERGHSQEHLYEYLKMNAVPYEWVETLPHWPVMESAYYMHRDVPRSEGKLDGFLGMLSPETAEDREIIKAMIATLFWGGRPGARPAFLLTSPELDPQQGRGVGKTALASLVAEELAGGYVDVSPSDDMGDVKTRLLSKGARFRRVVRIDNLKVDRLSWADLEGLITANRISGRKLYNGEGSRPNTMVFILTVNGGVTSKDMAQRLVPIRLARPRIYEPDWEERARSFLRQNLWSIAADCRGIIQREPRPLAKPTRWSAWERDILSKMEDPDAIQEVLLRRRAEIDGDEEDRDEVIGIIKERLTRAGHDPDMCCFFLRSGTIAGWVNEGLRTQDAVNKISGMIRRLESPQLRKSKRGSPGFIWRGKAVPAQAKPDGWPES